MSNELGKQWMESKHWGGWRVGMCIHLQDWVVTQACPPVFWRQSSGAHFLHELDKPELLQLFNRDRLSPDLDHPGTLAFLIEDVAKAWSDALDLLCPFFDISVRPMGVSVRVHDTESGVVPTLAEALIVVLGMTP